MYNLYCRSYNLRNVELNTTSKNERVKHIFGNHTPFFSAYISLLNLSYYFLLSNMKCFTELGDGKLSPLPSPSDKLAVRQAVGVQGVCVWGV